jgi:hypothetical protein
MMSIFTSQYLLRVAIRPKDQRSHQGKQTLLVLLRGRDCNLERTTTSGINV